MIVSISSKVLNNSMSRLKVKLIFVFVKEKRMVWIIIKWWLMLMMKMETFWQKKIVEEIHTIVIIEEYSTHLPLKESTDLTIMEESDSKRKIKKIYEK